MSILKIKFYVQIFQRLYISIIIEQLTKKVQVFVRKTRKMHRLNVNLNIWVNPNELREDHGWKNWFYSKVIYPFYENILIKRWKFWKNVIVYISILLWDLRFLTKCFPIKNSGITFQSWKSFSNNLFSQEHCILVILFLMSTFFVPSFS